MYGTGNYPPAQQQYGGYPQYGQPQQPPMTMGGGLGGMPQGYSAPSQYPPTTGYGGQQGGYNSSYMPPAQPNALYGGGIPTAPTPGAYLQNPMMQGAYGGQPGGFQQPLPQQRPESTDGTQYKLKKIFNGMDKDSDGRLSEEELRGALINGDYTKFNPETVKVMVKMFDRNRNNSIDFEEFVHLWKYLADWRKLFSRFDSDGNDTISLKEFDDAMRAFGYRLTRQFVQNLFSQYSHTSRKRERVISFDMFVQCCISVKRMTEEFKQHDTDRDGYVTLDFETFLTSVMNLR